LFDPLTEICFLWSQITFAAPAGPNPPLDPTSVEQFKEDEESVKFLNDETAKTKLANALVLQDVKIQDYDALFYVGGHGPVIDLPTDPTNIKLLEDAVHQKKLIAAVCHGPAALVGPQIKHLLHKHSIFHGKRFTGFSNVEEEQAGMVKEIPFLLEDRIIELGGKYEKAEKPWEAHVVVDGLLLTGQNPASARPLAQAVHKALSQHEAALVQGAEMVGAQGGRMPAI